MRGHLPAFVVASEHRDGLGEVGLQCEEQEHALHGERPSIHVIPQEQVLSFVGTSADFEQLQEVVVLAVDVSHNSHWVADAD